MRKIVIDKGIRKVVQDGKVAVLYSPGYGAGWYSWNDSSLKECLFDPEIVELVEQNKKEEIPELAEIKWGQKSENPKYFCSLGATQLEIEWLDVNTLFEISEYDGYEHVKTLGNSEFIVA